MEENKQKQKKTITIIVVVFALLLAVGAIAFFMNNKDLSKQKKPKDSTKTEEKQKTSKHRANSPSLEPIVVKDLFKIECTNSSEKPYTGYAIGDVMSCTLSYDTNNVGFESKDNIIYNFATSITTSENIDIDGITVTGLSNKKHFKDLRIETTRNTVKVENTNEYPSVVNCDPQSGSCSQTIRTRSLATIIENQKEFKYFEDSVANIEIHMDFKVNSKLADNPFINISINDFQFSTYLESRQIQPFFTYAVYNYDTNNNSKYYVQGKTVFEFQSGKYVESFNIQCKDINCLASQRDELINFGYVRVNEYQINSDETMTWLYDLNNKQEYGNYKSVRSVQYNNIYYLIGNSIDNPQKYTITNLNENKVLNEFDKPEDLKIIGTQEKDGIIRITFEEIENQSLTDGYPFLEYDIATNTFLNEIS